MATAAPTAVTAEAGRPGVGSVTVCTVDAAGTWKMMGDPVPVRGLPPRALFANAMPPAGCDAWLHQVFAHSRPTM